MKIYGKNVQLSGPICFKNTYIFAIQKDFKSFLPAKNYLKKLVFKIKILFTQKNIIKKSKN
jgi:hypothetical protein